MDLYKESPSLIVFDCQRDQIALEEFLIEKNISGRLFRRLYRRKDIYLNGKFVRKSTMLKKGDRVSIYMEDEENNITPERMDLDILYEDYDILVINKGPDIVVHPTKSHQEGTLSNGIAITSRNNIQKKIRFVNRLDMDTTGILIVAKPLWPQQMGSSWKKICS